MALRSPALWMGNPAVQHTAQNDRLSRAGLLRAEVGSTASNKPLTAVSGVLAGPPGTMGEVTLLSNTQFTVNPARWVIQPSASALAGAYEVTNDAVSTLAITAQDATQWRRSFFGVWTGDSFAAGSGDDLPHWGLVDGPLAPSNPVQAVVALPNWVALGEFLIPPVGQAVTFTPYEVRTGLRGGILPVTATDTRNGAFIGQHRDHPTNGLERWDGGKWTTPTPLGQWTRMGGGSGYANGVVGDSQWRTPPLPGLAGGITSYSLTVPNGRQAEIVYYYPAITVATNTTLRLRLRNWTSSGVLDDLEMIASSSFIAPGRLFGLVGGNGTVVSVGPEVMATNNGCALSGDPSGSGEPYFQYRIL